MVPFCSPSVAWARGWEGWLESAWACLLVAGEGCKACADRRWSLPPSSPSPLSNSSKLLLSSSINSPRRPAHPSHLSSSTTAAWARVWALAWAEWLASVAASALRAPDRHLLWPLVTLTSSYPPPPRWPAGPPQRPRWAEASQSRRRPPRCRRAQTNSISLRITSTLAPSRILLGQGPWLTKRRAAAMSPLQPEISSSCPRRLHYPPLLLLRVVPTQRRLRIVRLPMRRPQPPAPTPSQCHRALCIRHTTLLRQTLPTTTAKEALVAP